MHPQVCPWGYFHRNLTDKGRLTLNTEIGRSVMYPIVYFIHLHLSSSVPSNLPISSTPYLIPRELHIISTCSINHPIHMHWSCILSDTFSDFDLDHSSLCYISSFFLPLPTYDVFQNMCTRAEGLWSLSDFWF